MSVERCAYEPCGLARWNDADRFRILHSSHPGKDAAENVALCADALRRRIESAEDDPGIGVVNLAGVVFPPGVSLVREFTKAPKAGINPYRKAAVTFSFGTASTETRS